MCICAVWTIVLSILYSLFFFMSLCAVFGPTGTIHTHTYTLTHFSTNRCAVPGRPVQFSKVEYSTFSNALTFENLYQFFSCAFPKFSCELAPQFNVDSLYSWLLRFSCQVTCVCLAANKKLKSLSYPPFDNLHAAASCFSRIPFRGAINFDSCAKLIAA